jgi:hypothetical protein
MTQFLKRFHCIIHTELQKRYVVFEYNYIILHINFNIYNTLYIHVPIL